MNTDQILSTFEPLFTVALERLSRFKGAESRDVVKIFYPIFASISRAAGVDESRAASLIASWDPSTVTAETLRGAVAQIIRPTMDTMELAKARQSEIDAQIAADSSAHPPTERGRVLAERSQTPLAQRSRQSIEDELYEANTGKTRDGERLPQISARHWKALEPHFAALEQELEQRDCALAGVPYLAPQN